MRAFTTTLLCLIAQQLVPTACVPSFSVDLDLPPEKRWVDVANHYKTEMVAMCEALAPIFEKHIGKAALESWLKVPFGAEYEAELQGIVDTVNSSAVTLRALKLTNMLYELQSPTACSGVLWATKNGTVMHGRNMDYGFHFQVPDGRWMNWPDVTFETTFHKAGKKLLMSTMWPGSVGIHTAMRFDGWTFEQNTRSSKNEKHLNLLAAKAGGQPFALAVRRIMETTPRYQDALEKIYETKFMAPQYFIMSGAGPFEGAVLTIDRLGKHLADTPPIQTVSSSSKAWHLVQTNDDLLHAPLDGRRPMANEMLHFATQDIISEDHLLQFMHSKPLFNHETVFSTVMVPRTGFYKTALPSDPPGPHKSIKSLASMVSDNVNLALPSIRKEGKRQKRAFLAVHSHGLEQ